MKVNEALSILGLGKQGTVTIQEIKQAYRKACKTYHPDRNPAGLEVMKAVNAAYDHLQDVLKKSGTDTLNNEQAGEDTQQANYGEELNAALNALMQMQGLELELCGIWVWITGDTKTHKEALKKVGCKWAAKKKAWYFRPTFWKRSGFSRGRFSMDDIRGKYGSKKPGFKTRTSVEQEAA